MFNSKMGSMLKIMNGANVNASSGSVSNSGGGLIGGIVDAVNNPNNEDGTPKDAFDVAKDIAGSVIDSVTGNDKNKIIKIMILVIIRIRIKIKLKKIQMLVVLV